MIPSSLRNIDTGVHNLKNIKKNKLMGDKYF